MQNQHARREPVFNVPAPVLWLIAIFCAVHLLRSSLPSETNQWLTVALAFIPARFTHLADQLPGGDWALVTSWLSHAFIHGDLFHLGINCAWMLAFGSALARRIGARRFFLLAGICAIAGALAFMAGNWGEVRLMVGASGGIAGLMGAMMRFLFNAMSGPRPYDLRENIRAVPRMALVEALLDRRVLLSSLAWVIINLVFGFGASALTNAGGIAWEAHLGGYFAGLLLFGLFDTGRAYPYDSSDYLPDALADSSVDDDDN